MARLYWSAAGVTSSPESASGATYMSVPTKKPARVSRSAGEMSVSVAMPKSRSLICRVAGSYITFSGFKSRWTMFTSWAACTAPASCSTICATSSRGRGALRLM